MKKFHNPSRPPFQTQSHHNPSPIPPPHHNSKPNAHLSNTIDVYVFGNPINSTDDARGSTMSCFSRGISWTTYI